jgi:RES domain-containing protein
MILWRISRFHDLSGLGGLKYEARWHFVGAPVVYTTDSPAGALLETCVHTSADDLSPTFNLLKIVGPASVANEIRSANLPPDWVTQVETTQRLGSAWLENQSSVLLRVPSALVPETWNYLVNPRHPDAESFQIERSYLYPFDLRLKA